MSVNPRQELWYEVHKVHGGQGPPLLLVHGMLSSRAQWRENVAALAEVCRPVVVELLGHGRSPAPEDPLRYRPESYVEAFERIRRELSVERWPVCGQSLGAALTLRYALEHPERVTAHVFTNSNSALAESGWGERIRAGLRGYLERLEREGRAALESSPVHPRHARSLPEATRDALVADAELHDPGGVGMTAFETVPFSSSRERVHENRVRSLLVVGEREQRFRAHRDFALAHMPALRVVSADAGHAVNIEAAKVFNEEVCGFLRDHA